MTVKLRSGFFLSLLSLIVVLSVACHQQTKSEKGSTLTALVEKVREGERTKLGGDVALQLRLRDKKEEIPAHGQLVFDEGQLHAIAVTDTNDLILIFRTGSIAYFCLTDFSGKLRRAFEARPGDQKVSPAVSEEVESVFMGEIKFWKTYFGIAE